jgi:DNA polymerase-4
MLRALYLDFNSYFASVEQELNPALRGKPVAVVPSLVDTTCAIAASTEAKNHGVRTGTGVAEARRLCPGIHFIQAQPQRYVEWHHKLLGAVENCAPIASVNSIDELWIRLQGRDAEPDKALHLAKTIKAEIRTIAEHITCSIGIAPNEFLAKTASEIKKPDGLILIRQEDLPDALYKLKLRDYCGIGRQMHLRLEKAGIITSHDLVHADMRTLRQVWGGIEGERMWHKLRGDAFERAPSKRASIGHSHVLAPDLRTHLSAQAVLSRLTQKAAMRLRDMGYVTRLLSINVKCRDGSRIDEQQTIDTTDDTRLLLHEVNKLYQNALHTWFRHAQPMAIGVTFSHLLKREETSQPLFNAFTEEANAQGKPLIKINRDKLNAAMDKINLRYGKHSVYYASAHKGLHAAPMRIAFNHVPDLKTESDQKPDESLRQHARRHNAEQLVQLASEPASLMALID